jgi:hypothetical protein
MIQIIIQQVARFNRLNQMIFNNIAENTYKIKHTTTRQLSCFISRHSNKYIDIITITH